MSAKNIHILVDKPNTPLKASDLRADLRELVLTAFDFIGLIIPSVTPEAATICRDKFGIKIPADHQKNLRDHVFKKGDEVILVGDVPNGVHRFFVE